MFSINSALNRSAILLCCSADARTFRIVTYLLEQGAPVKNGQLYQKKKSSGPKNFKKMCFLVFSHITALNLFAILL